MSGKYNAPLPEPFLLKVFLEPPYEISKRELEAFIEKYQLQKYLDLTRKGRRGEEDLSKLHVDLYGESLYDQNGLLIWTEERIKHEGYIWEGSVYPRPQSESGHPLK